VRRIFAPEDLADELREALCEELGRVVVGNPADDGVGMGPVATANQLRDGRAGIELLAGEGRVVTGGAGAIAERGYFIAPTLIEIADGASASRVHQHEVFGPCASLIRYDGGAARAAELVARGQGCLVSSVYADDRDWLTEFLFAAAPWNGRVVVGSEKVADQVLPPGMVLPNQVHGGPGRAGGGEELGGLRGLEHYTQRVALQGDAGLLRKILE
jgi:oxepin-CoA hydrolase/3-oxo-5,6-dehydrosuberyl-CoA semialdehyde dehydrogenase